jgi:CSLREA domain-containing protein
MISTKTEREAKGRALAPGLLVAALLAMLLLGAADSARAAATFFVNTTNDRVDENPGDGSCYTGVRILHEDGFLEEECTLRAAIQEANAFPGADTINFFILSTEDSNCNATTNVCTISPASTLPTITDAATINGYSQPGASANTVTTGTNAELKIELNGANAGSSSSGLTVGAANSVVKGLVINSFSRVGIYITGGTGSKVEGNYVGTDATGTQDLGNVFHGVAIGDDAPNNTVGGTTAGARNTISGNDADGVGIFYAGARGSKVEGNYIGTDATGTQDLGNSRYGVSILEAPNNTVGGTTAGARNVISGNDESGVRISGADARGNKVMGNRIGTDKNGTAPLGNTFGGVLIIFSGENSNNTVGGAASARNTIAFNGTNGITAFSSVRNRILSNSIHSNDELGIDLGNDGITPNDPQDPDTGPNNLQNFPVLTSAITTTIKGKLNSKPSQTYKVQLFSNPASTNEGKKFLGQKSVTTGADGKVSFAFEPAQAVKVGQAVTATATDPDGNTSEFSESLEVVVP